MEEVIKEIAEKLSEFIRMREIREMKGGSLTEPPFYLIRRPDSTRNNFELLFKTADTEFEFEGEAIPIIDRMKELFLGVDE